MFSGASLGRYIASSSIRCVHTSGRVIGSPGGFVFLEDRRSPAGTASLWLLASGGIGRAAFGVRHVGGEHQSQVVQEELQLVVG